ncbi:MAG: BlaI/MecI/CopY family transcriptional regulator [Eubacterium sp.]|nr:BlaI/MecI/CopY family transcriptional regulator [Eubacterium sp.]
MEKETTPSQSEWLVMEALWANDTSMTAKEVIQKMQQTTDMSPRMVRVLLNRLWQKGVISYTVDTQDARVYHYTAVKSKEECQKEKSRKFVDSYFAGSQTNAMAALLESARLTEEQYQEMQEILIQCRETKRNEKQPGKHLLKRPGNILHKGSAKT